MKLFAILIRIIFLPIVLLFFVTAVISFIFIGNTGNFKFTLDNKQTGKKY